MYRSLPSLPRLALTRLGLSQACRSFYSVPQTLHQISARLADARKEETIVLPFFNLNPLVSSCGGILWKTSNEFMTVLQYPHCKAR
mmetsp:Transcript_46407/g.119770  ORF Transcript_46407/g.119770 Transcript_46407/m.119770 type:complete len:86 (-) Transcript_46407:599-856(-)